MSNIIKLEKTGCCYDCRKVCTKDYQFIDVYIADDFKTTLIVHNACYKRATEGGEPVNPEDITITEPKSSTSRREESCSAFFVPNQKGNFKCL